MGIRDSVPNRPLVFFAAFLSVLALTFSGCYALARGTSAPAHGPDRASATPVSFYGPVGPDAQERDLAQRIARIKDNTTHGH